MELIYSGIAGIVAVILIVAIWYAKRGSKVVLQPLNWSRVSSLLMGGKRIISEYRGHSIWLGVINTNKTRLRTQFTDSYPTTTIIIESDDIVKVKPLDDFFDGEKIIVEEIAQALIPNSLEHTIKGEIFVATNGCRVVYTQRGTEVDIIYLEFLLNMLIDLIEAYPLVIALGGEIVPILISIKHNKSHRLCSMASQILRDIELDTMARLGSNPSRFLCPRCFIRCTSRKREISMGNYVRYYGCRQCGCSRDVIDWPGQVAVVLDNRGGSESTIHQGVLRENWFRHRTPFDFDEAWILRATDEEVERFCVKIGNDTDKTREGKYEQMHCTVSSDCGLSANSLKILGCTFGKVEIVELIH